MRHAQGHSTIFSQVQAYWEILRHIEAYSGIIEAYGATCLYNRAIFKTLAYSKPEASSKDCPTCKVIMHIQSPVIVKTVYSSIFSRIFRRIEGYWCIFSHTHKRATRGGGGRRGLPCFFKNRKKCPDFGQKNPDCVHLWIKFSIQNVVSRVIKRKNSKMFPWEAIFLVFFTKCLLKCPSFIPPSSTALKNFFCAPAPALTVHLKCLTIFWIRVCLDNCSVICTVTLGYLLHQIHL